MKAIIEHLDKRVFRWCLLEYTHISNIIGKENVIFTNVMKDNEKLESLGEVKKKSVKEMKLKNVCILDPLAKKTLSKDDDFDYYIFGGVLGNHPMDGRTKEQISDFFPDAKKRNIGQKQMSTDTAVLITKKIVDDKKDFSSLKFIDEPEIEIEDGFSDILPYRYLKEDGKPVFPDGLLDYLKDEEKYIEEEEHME